MRYSQHISAISASPPNNASATSPSFRPPLSPARSTPSFPQSPNSPPPWQLPGPPPSAPPLSQVIFATYSPSTYGPMPGARHSPVNLGLRHGDASLGTPDTSRWGVKYNHQDTLGRVEGSKPALPVRISRCCPCTLDVLIGIHLVLAKAK